ncbi:uncharacterized protein CTHT_0051480 [Thermochaetoides thermophila DSM 1495]|uniref:HTH APSES-type domain-containing protein n=1 Tax=Chaetomium thermophilum (strain DSM 1495 / CBS 144.50 / IMI 039719) TaxID=759272 RepID=G0SDE3_CHATD|nr:hypothetical protein CTHT_0051480 [Thermochaetoides thermophila DSM 1495]EGS18544.1 hypothetical protein CTHT_0051480 [Thermochaetoides thermophila DSM 1495]
MNGPQMYYQSHLSGGQAPPPPPPQPVTPHYAPPPQQPPLAQPAPIQYGPAPPPGYGSHYGYANGLSSPAGPTSTMPPPMTSPLPLPPVSQPALPPTYSPGFDTTGQIPPPGMKPRVTATLWEDEGSLCFQVEARGICVARREDNHMINGTKLLNVAGMTRGRRDGILKSEKIRHVVKIGPMHLKGVWIPFERALDFANKEKITELLYPLFVHNIGALLCHPSNSARTSQVMAAAARSRAEPRIPAPLPPLHHPLALPAPPQAPPPVSQPPPVTSRPGAVDQRTPSFSAPSTTTSGVIGTASDNYQWSQQNLSNGQPTSQITTVDSNGRSLPGTPTTTPPGSTMPSIQSSYPPVTQSYDSSRSVYPVPSAQASTYPTSTSAPDRPLYSHSSYIKTEIAAPSSRPAGSEPIDQKPPNGIQGEVVQSGVVEELPSDHEEGGEYTHDSGAYDTNRSSYNYTAPPVTSLPGEHSHISSDLSGSPHQGSGRATPRSAAAPQTYYGQQSYNSPPRAGQTSSSLYSVMSNERGAPTTNGTSSGDAYGTQGDVTSSMQNGYAPQSMLNGSAGVKRGRDDDDDRDMKRRKTFDGNPLPSPAYSNPMTRTQPRAIAATQQRR